MSDYQRGRHDDDDRAGAALYTAEDMARVLAVSVRHVWRMRDARLMPAGVRLGRLVRWPKAAIEDWVAAGCPRCR